MPTEVQQRHSPEFSIGIALLVVALLAAGLLGIVAIYAASLRAGSEAVFRAHAASYAADLASRIQANAAAGLAYGSSHYSRPDVKPTCNREDSACTPEERAAAELFRWEHELMAVLPDNDDNAATPQWSIEVLGDEPPRSYVITINWSVPGAYAPLSYVLTFKA